MRAADKPLRWMTDVLRTPPLGSDARIECGVLLRRLQRGEALEMPLSRPMPTLGSRVHELRVEDRVTRRSWRVLYRIDPDAILVVHWFAKTTSSTPQRALELCRKRLAEYDRG